MPHYTIDDGTAFRSVSPRLTAGKTATQSSTESGLAAGFAVDGTFDGSARSSTQHQDNPWWRVDLSSVVSITEIRIRNRNDCCGQRLDSMQVLVSSTEDMASAFVCTDRATVPTIQASGEAGDTFVPEDKRIVGITDSHRGHTFVVKCRKKARYVWVNLNTQSRLSMAEVNVISAEELSFGWQTSQVDRYNNYPHAYMDNDWLVQGALRPRKDAVWEVSLPDGSYNVIVGVGSTKPNRHQADQYNVELDIEGKPAFSRSNVAERKLSDIWRNEWRDVRKLVQVLDGRLTLKFHNEVTLINYVRIFTDRFVLLTPWEVDDDQLTSLIHERTSEGQTLDNLSPPQGSWQDIRDRAGRSVKMLGLFPGNTQEGQRKIIKLEGLDTHTAVRISLRMWAMDSWDSGEHAVVKVRVPVDEATGVSSCSINPSHCSGAACCWREVWRKNRYSYNDCNRGGWRTWWGTVYNPWSGNRPSHEDDGSRHACYADVDVTISHETDTLEVALIVPLNQGIADESWGFSHVNLYAKSQGSSFAVGPRVNFGSGSDVEVLSLGHVNGGPPNQIYLNGDETDPVALLNASNNGTFVSSQSRNGDIISTSAAFDIVSRTPGGLDWIPINYKNREQYVPTPFGDKQKIEVMCATPDVGDGAGGAGAVSLADATFYDYDSFEEETWNDDRWGPRNGHGWSTQDCDTAYSGLCSTSFGNAPYGVNWEWTSYNDGAETHLSSKTPDFLGEVHVAHQGHPGYWNYVHNPYMCMAYRMPPGTIVNMLVYVDGLSWRSITFTQTKNPTSYRKGADFGELITNDKWHYKCINVRDGLIQTGNYHSRNTISRLIWYNGGGTAYPSNNNFKFWIDDFAITNMPLDLYMPTKVPPVTLAPRVVQKNTTSDPPILVPKLAKPVATTVQKQGATFFDYDTFEKDTWNEDYWSTRNSRPQCTQDCETAYYGQCSQKCESGAYNRNWEHGTRYEVNKNYPDTSVGPVSHGNNGYYWNYKKFPWMCMAYNMPENTVINMLIHIEWIGWRSVTMTQTKNPTGYRQAADFGNMVTDGEWHFKCINIYQQLKVSGSCREDNPHIGAVIWYPGGGADYPRGPGHFHIDEFSIGELNLERLEVPVPGHALPGKFRLTMDHVGSLCVMSGLLWAAHGTTHNGHYLFYLPPACRWGYNTGHYRLMSAATGEGAVRINSHYHGWVRIDTGTSSTNQNPSRFISTNQLVYTTSPGTQLAMEPGWHRHSNSYGNPSWRRQGKLCMLEGLINQGSWDGDGSMFKLPYACRPENDLLLPLQKHQYMGGLLLRADGSAHYDHTGVRVHNWYGLSGITFAVRDGTPIEDFGYGWGDESFRARDSIMGDWRKPSYTLEQTLCSVGGRVYFERDRFDADAPHLLEAPAVARDCGDILAKDSAAVTGNYMVDPDGEGAFPVRCDFNTPGGPYTVFQRRFDGKINFKRKFEEYEKGFPRPGNYFVGIRTTYNWQDAKTVCEFEGKEMCTRKQVCPDAQEGSTPTMSGFL